MSDPADTLDQYDWEKHDKQALLNEKLFQRGINDGYLIAQYEPALAQSMSKDMNPQPAYESGFLEGGKEWQKEIAKQRLNELKNLRNKGRDKTDRER